MPVSLLIRSFRSLPLHLPGSLPSVCPACRGGLAHATARQVFFRLFFHPPFLPRFLPQCQPSLFSIVPGTIAGTNCSLANRAALQSTRMAIEHPDPSTPLNNATSRAIITICCCHGSTPPSPVKRPFPKGHIAQAPQWVKKSPEPPIWILQTDLQARARSLPGVIVFRRTVKAQLMVIPTATRIKPLILAYSAVIIGCIALQQEK